MSIYKLGSIITIGIVSIALCNNINIKTSEIYLSSVRPVRSHHVGLHWETDYMDSNGNIFQVIEGNRPEIRNYTLIMDNNGTPYDVTDDIVENIL